jgi:2-polyprenyl-3-methyl-5-hydroxy-6-metoxy-1,4-benzoquinol methylase
MWIAMSKEEILNDKSFLTNLERYYDYDGWETRYNHYLRIVLMDRIFRSIDTKGKALDVGCSAGAQSFSLERNGFSVTGIDLGEKDLVKAREWGRSVGSKCEFKAMDISNTEFADGTFDLVLCSEVMEHVLDQRKVVSEISRITKKGGYVIFSMPNGESPYWKRKKKEMKLKGKNTDVSKAVAGSAEWHSIRHFTFTIKEIESLTSDPSFEKKGTDSCGFFIPPLSILIRIMIITGIGYRIEEAKRKGREGATYLVWYRKR